MKCRRIGVTCTGYVKSLARRVVPGAANQPRRDPDIEVATPLVGLLQEADPGPELFAQIEAQLDAEVPVQLPKRHSRQVRQVLPLVVGACFGVASTIAVFQFTSDRQRIVARPAPNVSWSELGAVTLHGAELRTLVRTKCRGHTHFYITMHGHVARPDGLAEVPLMNDGEKILMECIF